MADNENLLTTTESFRIRRAELDWDLPATIFELRDLTFDGLRIVAMAQVVIDGALEIDEDPADFFAAMIGKLRRDLISFQRREMLHE